MNGKLEIYKELKYPNLSYTEYEVTSKATKAYNCFAWAAKEDDRWWSPEPDGFWPDGVPRELTIEVVNQVYQTLGYEPCDNADLEPGFEKIAIYVTSDGEPQHAARQLPNGKWTSKLGNWEDISHELEGLANQMFYGEVKQILKRTL